MRWKNLGMVLMTAGFIGIILLSPVFAYEDPVCSSDLDNTQKEAAGCNVSGAESTLQSKFQNVVNTVLGVLGGVAVLVIVIGGIMMATATGDTAKVAKARNMILYAVVGLAVAVLAYAIVNFFLNTAF